MIKKLYVAIRDTIKNHRLDKKYSEPIRLWANRISGWTVVATAFLAYLQAHPHASDSLEGIVSWWIPSRFMVKREAVRKSIDQLVEQGLLERIRLAGGMVVYARAQQGSQPQHGSQLPRGGRTPLPGGRA